MTAPARSMAVLALLTAIVFAPRVRTQTPRVPDPGGRTWGATGELHSFHVQGNVWLIVGAGGNIVVQKGSDGVLVVDTGLAQHAQKVLAEIGKLSTGRIRLIVNTHVHPDHTGGNEAISTAGVVLSGGPAGALAGTPATIIAHENVLTRMSAPAGRPGATPTAAWPTNTYVPETKDLFFNDEPVLLYHDKAAHTDGDSIVFFRRSDVIAAGDVLSLATYPFIDRANGGSVQGVLDGLNRILELAVPKHQQEGGTFVVPGHGRVCDEADVLEYRDMVTIVRDRIQDMAKRGLTLEQVKAAKPTVDYDGHYGTDSGFWTTAQFIDAVYKDVSRQP